MAAETEDERINRLLEEVLGPPPAHIVPPVSARMLDGILGSRTHVRTLRVLVALDQHINLTARDVARRAEASHVRVQEVLRELMRQGVVTAAQTPTHAIYRLGEKHPLLPRLRELFEEESRTDPAT